jgi:hypothetical protein
VNDVKRFLLIAILLIFLPLNANAFTVLTSGYGGSTPDSCTGGLIFSWHCENTDVTIGTPQGCSGGATTGTPNGSAAINADISPYDGTYNCDFPADSSYYAFSVSSDDIFNDSAGTIVMHVYIHTFLNSERMFTAYQVAGTNNLIVQMISDTTRRFRLRYIGNSVEQNIETTGDFPLDTWITITAKWSVAGVGGNYLYIDYDGGNSATGTTAITPWTANAYYLRVGNYSPAGTVDYTLGAIKIYSSWQ